MGFSTVSILNFAKFTVWNGFNLHFLFTIAVVRVFKMFIGCADFLFSELPFNNPIHVPNGLPVFSLLIYKSHLYM